MNFEIQVASDIADCQRRIEQQVVWIEQLRRAGQDSELATRQLDHLCATMTQLRAHRAVSRFVPPQHASTTSQTDTSHRRKRNA